MPGSMMIARRIKDTVEYTHAASKVAPVTGELTLTGGAGANAAGSYTEVAASLSSKVKIESICIYGLSAADRYTVDIAIGAAASETVLSSVSVGGAVAASFVVPINIPTIESGSRLAARVASVSGGGDTCKIAINYIEVV
jgi:hypothetical protein